MLLHASLHKSLLTWLQTLPGYRIQAFGRNSKNTYKSWYQQISQAEEEVDTYHQCCTVSKNYQVRGGNHCLEWMLTWLSYTQSQNELMLFINSGRTSSMHWLS